MKLRPSSSPPGGMKNGRADVFPMTPLRERKMLFHRSHHSEHRCHRAFVRARGVCAFRQILRSTRCYKSAALPRNAQKLVDDTRRNLLLLSLYDIPSSSPLLKNEAVNVTKQVDRQRRLLSVYSYTRRAECPGPHYFKRNRYRMPNKMATAQLYYEQPVYIYPRGRSYSIHRWQPIGVSPNLNEVCRIPVLTNTSLAALHPKTIDSE